MNLQKMTYPEWANELRGKIQSITESVDFYKKDISSAEPTENENRGEVMANITLAYRHLEDAKMRLGKVIQHLSGGVSVCDTPVK